LTDPQETSESISCRAWLPSALASFLILLAAGAEIRGQSAVAAPQASPNVPIVLTNVRIIDGTGAPAMTNQSLVIEDGRIKTIGPSL
jgi:hypothetical protein